MSTLRDLVGGQGCAPGVNGNPIAALFSQVHARASSTWVYFLCYSTMGHAAVLMLPFVHE